MVSMLELARYFGQEKAGPGGNYMKKIATFAAAALLYCTVASASPLHGIIGIKAGQNRVAAPAVASAVHLKGTESLSVAAESLPSYVPTSTSHFRNAMGISETGSLMILGAVMISVAGLLIRRKNSSPAAA